MIIRKKLATENTVNNRKENTNDYKRAKLETKIIMCFDSNRKFLNFRKLWTLDGSERRKCSTLTSVRSAIENETAKNVEYFLISVGTNDIDTKDPKTIYNEYVEIINLLRRKYSGIKIIISGLPPRKYNKDKEVIELNKLLRNLGNYNNFIFLVDHSNLRDDTYSMFYDDKNIHKSSISRFAGNIKRALRKAYGQPEPPKRGAIVKQTQP